ncbi:MAG: LytR C-terminal domain-containing protein [Candidatus Shapirobacteria bacterium]
MKAIKKVIYWHRFGQKVYEVPANSSPILEKEIVSSEVDKIEEGLKYLSGQSVLLLLSDSISYLYEKVIDPPLAVDESFKRKLQELIKSDIPEDFSEFTWDYKVDNDFDGKQKVIVFAPIKEFQTSINEVAKRLTIKIEAMETESVAATRDPNPILGILEKPDIKGRDEDTLNLSVTEEKKNRSGLYKILGVMFLAIILVVLTVIFLPRLQKKMVETPKQELKSTIEAVVSLVPTEAVATTSANLKKWSDLRVMVQNGTAQAGLASKMAESIKGEGIVLVESGNADKKDYVSSILIFKDNLLKESYQEKFLNLLSIGDDDIKVDGLIKFDVVLILGQD